MIKIEDNKFKFNALTPETLDKNKKVYTDALDSAFNNDEVKNIAITGIYGAGKTTVWRTYVKERDLSNIITVSLGKYEDSFDYDECISKFDEQDVENDNNNQSVEICDEYKKSDLDNDNRIEKQIINQILSQIDPKTIPLSKYRYKINKTRKKTNIQIISSIFFIVGLLLLLLSKPMIEAMREINSSFKSILYFITSGLLITAPLIYFLNVIFKENKIKISKINFRGAEANFDEDFEEETILDRDIKEIVYLLRSSGAKVVVIEDLDRYDNINVFTKLRELNFLVNKYSSVNGDKTPIKFVYMIRDGLFFSKNRTKFFDMIVPIVPVLDSSNSENILIKNLGDMVEKLDNKFIYKISLYIDDMRLLKNIVNEFAVYSRVLQMEELKLSYNKLFALIVLKNIFPKEFDELQEDRGYIYNIINNKEALISDFESDLEIDLKSYETDISDLQRAVECNKFDVMAAKIPPTIRLDETRYKSWTDVLKEMYDNQKNRFKFNQKHSSNYSGEVYYDYKEFVEEFNLLEDKTKKYIDKNESDLLKELDILKSKKNSLVKNITELKTISLKNLMSKLNMGEIDEHFNSNESKITRSHYFNLVKYLILDGLIDETYYLYKGLFYKGSLGVNDTIFMKNLLESAEQDIFFELENPNQVRMRLDIDDFRRHNILNQDLLKSCINSKNVNEITKIVESVDENNNYSLLVQILNAYQPNMITVFVEILSQIKNEYLIKSLNACDVENDFVYNNLLKSIFTSNKFTNERLSQFSPYLEKYEKIVSDIEASDFDNFIDNLSSAEVEFEDLSKCKSNSDRMKKLENISAFKLTVDNVIFISGLLLNKEVDYGKLLSEVFDSETLKSTKEYIDDNFNSFIEEYIDKNQNNEIYNNDESILIKMINSDIPVDHKIKYIEDNETMLKELSSINDLESNLSIVDIMLDKNTVQFNKENIKLYWDAIDEYGEEFTEYFDKNISEDNAEEIFNYVDGIANTLINSDIVSDKVFKFALISADEKIDNIVDDTSKERVAMLIKKDLLSINNENFDFLVKNSYDDELVDWVIRLDDTSENEAKNILLSFELSNNLIYKLANSEISDENSMSLLSKLPEGIKIKNIDFSKTNIIKKLINNGLNDDDINYICSKFENFIIKDVFVNYLERNNKFSIIENKNLSESFLNYIFNDIIISSESKIEVIITKIRAHSSIEELKNLISQVKEIAKLATVWESKRPALENQEKKKVGFALIEEKYVKQWGKGEKISISIN